MGTAALHVLYFLSVPVGVLYKVSWKNVCYPFWCGNGIIFYGIAELYNNVPILCKIYTYLWNIIKVSYNTGKDNSINDVFVTRRYDI